MNMKVATSGFGTSQRRRELTKEAHRKGLAAHSAMMAHRTAKARAAVTMCVAVLRVPQHNFYVNVNDKVTVNVNASWLFNSLGVLLS